MVVITINCNGAKILDKRWKIISNNKRISMFQINLGGI